MHAEARPAGILPDFCNGARVLRVLLAGEAVAIVLTLGGSLAADVLSRFLLMSIYIQWIGICSAAVLCLIRQFMGHRSTPLVAGISYVALLAITAIVTEVTFAAGHYSGFGLLLAGHSETGFLLRAVGICGVVAALVLRYFWLRSSWQQHADAQMRARLEALQARIEPHFLFNSLNSVAALIQIRPADAETALEDLALLLRSRLSAQAPDEVALEDEMALVNAYVRIEQLRLGERLIMDVDIAASAAHLRLPALCLQPLVENAIGHGVSRLSAGGTVTVRAWQDAEKLCIRVTNPVAAHAPSAPGNRQAVSNIERRLALRYAGQARLDFTHDDSWFTVDMVIPQDIEMPL